MRIVYLYGIGGPEKKYRVLNYHFLKDSDITINNMVFTADVLKIRNPAVKEVYAIDNYKGLRAEYQHAVFKNTIDIWQEFKNTLITQGIKIF